MRCALAAVAVSGLLAACGGDGGSDGTASGAGGDAAEVQDAALEYAQCMRDQGIEDFPDPEVGEDGELQMSTPDGGDPDEFAAADEECQPILREAQSEGPQLSPEERAERQDQALALARCMRGNGWDMPDPEVDEGGGIGVQNPDDIGGPGDPRLEEFEDDMAACNEEAGISAPPGGGELHGETDDDGGSDA